VAGNDVRYTPEYQKELDALKEGGKREEQVPVKKEAGEDVMRFSNEIEQEEAGETVKQEENKEIVKEEESEEMPDEELKLSEETQRQLTMMRKKDQQLFTKIKKTQQRKEKKIADLKKKAKAAKE
jgi:pescadillo protein